jgi:DNA-binding NtrC family response regulator
MKTVMLVDDERVSLMSLSESLRRMGYSTLSETDAEAALDHIRGGTKVDLIITDYCMPRLDGLAFIEHVRRLAPDLPVIMVTGYGDVESYLKACSLGVFEYLNKPVKAKELRRVVRSAIESSPLGSAASHI